MKTRTGLGLLLLIAVLAVCGCQKAMKDVREDLLGTIKQYNELVRLKDFDKAKQFVAESARGEFDARAPMARAATISEYRIIKREFVTTSDQEIVQVEIDYAIPPSTEKKTLINEQKWSFLYIRDEGGKRWRLVTPLPEFK